VPVHAFLHRPVERRSGFVNQDRIMHTNESLHASAETAAGPARTKIRSHHTQGNAAAAAPEAVAVHPATSAQPWCTPRQPP